MLRLAHRRTDTQVARFQDHDMPLPPHTEPDALLQVLMRQIPLGVFCNDLSGGAIFLSERCCEIIGTDEASALGEGWAQALHPEDRDRIVAAWNSSLAVGEFKDAYRFVHPDGTVRWVIGRGNALVDGDGRPIGFMGTIEDVTELHEVGARWGSTELLFDTILRNSSDLVVVADHEGTLVFLSAASRRILGRDPEHWVGRNAFDLIHPDDVGLAAEALVRTIDSGAGVKEPLELRVLNVESGWRSVEIVANNLSDDPRVGGLLINVRDMTERIQTRAVAEADRRRFEQVFELAPIGMALVSDTGAFVRVNGFLCRMLGRSAPELLRSGLFDFVHPGDRERGIQHALDVLEGRSDDPIEIRFLRSGGEVAWARVSATVVREGGVSVHSIAHIEDVTEQRVLRERLEVAATHDPLTGVLNRNGLQRSFTRSISSSSAGALLCIDLDRFKRVNDTFGHTAGDEMLELAALRIRMATRADDALARLGGDEFIVIVSGKPTEDEALALAERIRVLLGAPYQLRAGVASISGSIGVRILAETPVLSDELDHADAAAYRAKSRGGDLVELADRPADYCDQR